MSIETRINALMEALQPPAREPRSDVQIATSLCHLLVCAAHGKADMAGAVKLAKMIWPEADEAWLKRHWRPEAFGNSSHDEARWAAWKAAQKGIHAGSSLEQFMGTPERTPIRTQRVMSEEERIASPEFERQRAADIGKSELTNGTRQTMALTGLTRFRRK
jgi:hypothetical protein